jgi:hypothetical protein
MKSIVDAGDRARILERLSALDPERPPRWGRFTAPRMLAHLCDQMRLPLGSQSAARIPGPLRLPGLGWLVMCVLPWPRGRVQSPPEALLTDATDWESDLATLHGLVEQFANDERRDTWPDHPYFGRMSRRDWGIFCHRHIDHHLRQFGG